jgi:4,5-dihydroxyphthalate decarboxylase
MTALPVFLVRAFHHGATIVKAGSGIESPKDLEGKKVGVNRGYTVTTGLWARTILAQQYGVDLNSITWVLSGDEHVQEFVPPTNVVPVEKGKSLVDLLLAGELAAVVGAEVDHPELKPLIPNPDEAAFEALRTSGHYPINHTVVVKDEVLEKHPEVAAEVFNAFAESKRLYVQKLKAGQIEKPTAVDKMHLRVMKETGWVDPLPYGIEPNRKIVADVIKAARAQGILPRDYTVDELFASGTRGLVG